MCRERRRERKPSQRRAGSAIDMLDRQRRDKDGQADAHIQIRALEEPGVGFGFDSADSTARIRLSKPIVGPCKCQACVSFHMPAASRSTLLSLSLTLLLTLSFPFTLALRFVLVLFQSVLCDMNYTSFLAAFLWTFSSLLLCCVCGVCTSVCACVCQCRYNIIIKRIAKVCPQQTRVVRQALWQPEAL